VKTVAIRDRVIASLATTSGAYRLSEVEAALPPTKRGYPISRPLARLLSRLILNVPFQSVLEFGAGVSSVIMALSLKHGGGGRLTTIENDLTYCSDRWQTISQLECVDTCLVVSPLRQTEIFGRKMNIYANAGPKIAERGPYDIVFIDGPEGKYGREGTLHQSYAYLRDGAVIILDDCKRASERTAIRRWLSAYPNLEPILIDPQFGGRGVAILQVSKQSI